MLGGGAPGGGPRRGPGGPLTVADLLEGAQRAAAATATAAAAPAALLPSPAASAAATAAEGEELGSCLAIPGPDLQGSPQGAPPGAPIRRLMIERVVLENFKSYNKKRVIGPFHKVIITPADAADSFCLLLLIHLVSCLVCIKGGHVCCLLCLLSPRAAERQPQRQKYAATLQVSVTYIHIWVLWCMYTSALHRHCRAERFRKEQRHRCDAVRLWEKGPANSLAQSHRADP